MYISASRPHRELRTSRPRSAAYCGVALLFSTTAWSLHSGPWDGRLTYGFCGVLALTLALQTVFPYRLELDAEGFTARVFWKRRRTRWADCSEFRLWYFSPFLFWHGPAAIVYDELGRVRRRWWRGFNRMLTGGEVTLGGGRFGGYTPEELAELFNLYRAAAVHS